MAVDVPDSFIARNKTPPRYPPPRPPTQQVIYTPNGSQKQPLLSTSSATSSLKSGSSSIGNGGGVALDLQPPSFNNSTTTTTNTNTHVNNNHAIINTNNLHHSNNNHHMKNSTSSFDSCNIEFNNHKKSSSVKCPSSMGSVCESIGFDSMSYRTKSRGSLSTRSSSSGGELGPPEYDLGPHKEMAVDVPDNFVGVIKMPPRYPKSGGGSGSGSSSTANALQKSKESLTSTNSTSTTNEKDAIIPSTTNSQTINNITTPQTPNRNSEVLFFFYFRFVYFCILCFSLLLF